MQGESLPGDPFAQVGFAEDVGGLFGGFRGVDLPPDDLATEHIEDQIEVEKPMSAKVGWIYVTY